MFDRSVGKKPVPTIASSRTSTGGRTGMNPARPTWSSANRYSASDCVVGAQLITALQSIVSRSVDPLESAVISICEFHAGNVRNVIPQTAVLKGTVRTLTAKVRGLVEKRIREVVEGVAQITGAKIDLVYERGYPVTVNHAAQTDVAIEVAREIAGEANVRESPPMMGAEDFAYMLEARPGAFIFCGNGDSAGLHHPAYNFNDDAIVFGTSYWIKLVENTLAA